MTICLVAFRRYISGFCVSTELAVFHFNVQLAFRLLLLFTLRKFCFKKETQPYTHSATQSLFRCRHSPKRACNSATERSIYSGLSRFCFREQPRATEATLPWTVDRQLARICANHPFAVTGSAQRPRASIVVPGITTLARTRHTQRTTHPAQCE